MNCVVERREQKLEPYWKFTDMYVVEETLKFNINTLEKEANICLSHHFYFSNKEKILLTFCSPLKSSKDVDRQYHHKSFQFVIGLAGTTGDCGNHNCQQANVGERI